jgi:hypothetical protein
MMLGVDEAPGGIYGMLDEDAPSPPVPVCEEESVTVGPAEPLAVLLTAAVVVVERVFWPGLMVLPFSSVVIVTVAVG